MSTIWLFISSFYFLAGFFALPALADVAVGPVALAIGLSVYVLPLLLLVVFIEAIILWLLLARNSRYSFLEVLKQILLLNLVTAVLGVVWLFSGKPLSLSLEVTFFLQFLLTVLVELWLLKRYYSESLTEHSNAQVYRSGFLMNLATYALLFGLLYGANDNTSDRDNSYWKVKQSMYTLQTIAETYGVDWGGFYSPDIDALEQEGKIPRIGRNCNFWCEDILTPDGKDMLMRIELPGGRHRPMSIEYELLYSYEKGPIAYQIMGFDENGKPIKSGGKILFLTNS